MTKGQTMTKEISISNPRVFDPACRGAKAPDPPSSKALWRTSQGRSKCQNSKS